jgi:hypothetical protein
VWTLQPENGLEQSLYRSEFSRETSYGGRLHLFTDHEISDQYTEEYYKCTQLYLKFWKTTISREEKRFNTAYNQNKSSLEKVTPISNNQ